ncbi:S41 family peptidase [Bacteroidota bacterium]
MSIHISRASLKGLLIWVILAMPGYIHSQNQRFTPEQIREDIDFMFTKMEEVHPNLYYFMPEESVQNEKEKLLADITAPIDRIELCKAFKPLVSRLNDGHTSLRWPQQEIMRYVQMGGKFFPAAVYIDDNQLFVKASQDDILAPDARILEINNIPVVDIIKEMRKYISGEKTMYKDTRIAYRFSTYYWFLFQKGSRFKVRFQSGNEEPQSVNLKGLNAYEVDQLSTGSSTKKQNFEYRQLDERTSLIEFRSFSGREKFKEFLENSFKQIKETEIRNLIIDIRENGGGNSSLGDDLFNYITSKPYTQVDAMLVKLSDDVLNDGWGNWLNKDTLEHYRGKVFTSPAYLKDPGSNKLRFKGDVYLLTGPRSFSSANMFASTFKCYEIGTIVGEETGGLTVSYGDVRNYLLPNTQIHFGCSFKQFYEACGKQDWKGVLPDYEVKSIPSTSSDPVLDYTLDLIDKKQSTSYRKQK